MKKYFPYFLFLSSSAVLANDLPDNNKYYFSLKLLSLHEKARNYENTSPRVHYRVSGPEYQSHLNASIALGYQTSERSRFEFEYVPETRSSHNTVWYGTYYAFNQLSTKSQRFMLNGYFDLLSLHKTKIFVMAGIGEALVNASGWRQIIELNSLDTHSKRTNHNLAYSAGLGLSQQLSSQIFVELGYRYTNMGTIETGYKTFDRPDTTLLRDEYLKANLVAHDVFLGITYSF